MTEKIKRGVGRPRRQPENIQSLRLKALEGMDRSRERHKDERVIPLESLREEVDNLNTRKKYSAKEIEELRNMVNEMYEDHINRIAEEKAQQDRELNETLRNIHLDLGIQTEGKQLTEEEWNILHGLRPDGSKKRGPKPRKKKTVWQLEPGERGNGTEPASSLDLDQIQKMEQDYEAEMFEQEIERQKKQAWPTTGKRFRKNQTNTRPSVDQSKFYY